eukprot:2270769-Rhodomonas_salina.2
MLCNCLRTGVQSCHCDLSIPIAAPGNRYTAMLIQIKNTAKYFPSVAKQERALFFKFDQKVGLYPGMYLGVHTVKGEQRAGRVGVVRKGEVQVVAYVAPSLLDTDASDDRVPIA